MRGPRKKDGPCGAKPDAHLTPGSLSGTIAPGADSIAIGSGALRSDSSEGLYRCRTLRCFRKRDGQIGDGPNEVWRRRRHVRHLSRRTFGTRNQPEPLEFPLDGPGLLDTE